MKTNSPGTRFYSIFLLSTACLISWLPLAESSQAAPFQKNQVSETPDPYFDGSSSKKNPRSRSDFLPKSTSSLKESTPTPWEPPKTQLGPNLDIDTSKPEVQWDAPLTPAPSNQLQKRTKPKNVSGELAPKRNQAKEVGDFSSNFNNGGSIIREQTIGVSDSESNSFISPIEQDTKSKAAGSGGKSPTDNSFGSVDNNSTSNDFQADNSFAPPSMANSATPGKESGVNSKAMDLVDNNLGSDSQPARDLLKRSGNNEKPSGSEAASNSSKSFEPGKVLAIVGGEPIFVGDMLFEINQLIERYMPNAPTDVKDHERQKMIPQILPKFVEAKILFMGTQRMLPEGVDIESVLEQAATEFDEKALDEMIKASGLKSPTEFDANLRAMGSSLRKLRRSWAQDQLTKYFLSQKMNVKTEVTHQELLDNYRENIASYEVPAKCRWEQVMIRFDRSKSRAAAKEAVVELGNQIVYGANLAAVAKKSSHGFLASEGGQHDWTSKGALVLKEIDDAIFSLPVGELSDIIESRDGYHVIRVIERVDATRKPFLEAQVEIKKRFLDEKRKEAFNEHVQKLKREIPVEYFLNDDAAESIAATIPKTANR